MPAIFMEKTGIMLLSLIVLLGAVLILGAAVGLDYAKTQHAIEQSQQQWCDSLKLLTAPDTGVQVTDPKKTPNAYRLRQDWLALEREFKCG